MRTTRGAACGLRLTSLACAWLLTACTDPGCVRHTDCASQQMCVDGRCAAAAATGSDGGVQTDAMPAPRAGTDTDADGG